MLARGSPSRSTSDADEAYVCKETASWFRGRRLGEPRAASMHSGRGHVLLEIIGFRWKIKEGKEIKK